MWYIYSKLNMEEIGKILQYDINYWWIFLSGVIGLLSHIVRALRWKIQLKALPANPSMRVLTNAIFGTYAVNLILPRVGEVWRCAYVAQSEDKSFIKVVGSMISERLTDTLTVITITIITFFLQLDVLKEILNDNPSIKEGIVNIITSPALYSVIAVGIIALVWLFRFKSENTLIVKIKEMVNNLINGFKTIFKMKKKGLFLFYTILMWFLYFVELYVCFFAFKQTESLGIVCAFSCFLMGSIGMGVPVQGGLGPWHWAVIAVLTLYGLNNDTAGAFALVAHGTQLIMTILIGVYTFISISLYKKRGKEVNNS